MDMQDKKLSQETPPVTISTAKQDIGISQKSAALLHLISLYRTDRDDLFWVLYNMKKYLQNQEASHLADEVIAKAKR